MSSGLLQEEKVGSLSNDYPKKVTQKTNLLFLNSPSRDSGLVKRREDKMLHKEHKVTDYSSPKIEEKAFCSKNIPKTRWNYRDQCSEYIEVKNLKQTNKHENISKALENSQEALRPPMKSKKQGKNQSKDKEKISNKNQSENDNEFEKGLKRNEKESEDLEGHNQLSSKINHKKKGKGNSLKEVLQTLW